jgi:acetolactate synthase-1/2/3 large subunit
VHIDIDTAEIQKNKYAHIPLCADLKLSIQLLIDMLDKEPTECEKYIEWQSDIKRLKSDFPMQYLEREDLIVPQSAIQILYHETCGNATLSTGVGQHQMWAAQYYLMDQPRQWLTSGGLGSMGFGLPSALGAASAFDGRDGREKRLIVDIDGDGSFVMNCQELATVHVEDLETKIVILNNQHLGMVVQWEDRFYNANRAHTYLGARKAEWHETGNPEDIFPNFVKMADAFKVSARRVISPKLIQPTLKEMLDSPGPCLIDVMVPCVEHVLPMIPGGGSFKDIIVN